MRATKMYSEAKKHIGELLRTLRQTKGWSSDRCAREARVSHMAILLAETGDSVSLERQIHLLKAMGGKASLKVSLPSGEEKDIEL